MKRYLRRAEDACTLKSGKGKEKSPSAVIKYYFITESDCDSSSSSWTIKDYFIVQLACNSSSSRSYRYAVRHSVQLSSFQSFGWTAGLRRKPMTQTVRIWAGCIWRGCGKDLIRKSRQFVHFPIRIIRPNRNQGKIRISATFRILSQGYILYIYPFHLRMLSD